VFSSHIKSKVGNILVKFVPLRVNLNIDGEPIGSRSHKRTLSQKEFQGRHVFTSKEDTFSTIGCKSWNFLFHELEYDNICPQPSECDISLNRTDPGCPSQVNVR
jgi:hypothetical protein